MVLLASKTKSSTCAEYILSDYKQNNGNLEELKIQYQIYIKIIGLTEDNRCKEKKKNHSRL
jgi:hypothetical protein